MHYVVSFFRFAITLTRENTVCAWMKKQPLYQQPRGKLYSKLKFWGDRISLTHDIYVMMSNFRQYIA